MSAESVTVHVACPNCGATGYESGAQVSVPCDECPKRIAVDVSVYVQSLARADA